MHLEEAPISRPPRFFVKADWQIAGMDAMDPHGPLGPPLADPARGP